MADLISNLPPARGGSFDALLNLARGSLDNISEQVRNILNQQTPTLANVIREGGGIRVQVPQLSNLITGQQDVLLKTTSPIDPKQNFTINVENSNIVLDRNNQPILRLEGQLNSAATNAPLQRFTTEIPLSNVNRNPQAQNFAQNQLTTEDQVVRNFVSEGRLNAFTNNLNATIRPQLPQALQNINLAGQNNLDIKVINFTTPSGQQINIEVPQNPQASQTLTNTTQPTQIIQGRLEIFPEAKEALIRTEFGSFRVGNIVNIPNGSQVNFTIQGPAQTLPAENLQNIFNLNPTNIQTLKLSLESTDSAFQNLIRQLSALPGGLAEIQKLFPNPEDRASYARSLWFLSKTSAASPEGWLGDEGQRMVNSTPEADTNMGRLHEIFNHLRSFAGRTDAPVNSDWNSYIIPFYDGSKLSYITLQVQRDPEGQNQNSRSKKKFILELEQDQLGKVALEGLYSNFEGKINNMDMVIKSEKPMPEEFQKELTDLYNQTAIAYAFVGGLTFTSFSGQTQLYTDISKILGDGIVI